jgi:hypothetical protein
MLVQVDPQELGDTRLNPEESVYREREELLRMASTRKIDGQAELEDAERSMGPRITWQELIRRLCLCNSRLYFADAQGGKHIAVYRPKTSLERSEEEYDHDKQPWWNDHKYVGGFPKEDMPEWSHVILDSSMLPVREVRGWRSVLMSIIKAGGMTYASASKQFGEPTDQRSGRWHEQLQPYKYRG